MDKCSKVLMTLGYKYSSLGKFFNSFRLTRCYNEYIKSWSKYVTEVKKEKLWSWGKENQTVSLGNAIRWFFDECNLGQPIESDNDNVLNIQFKISFLEYSIDFS